MWTKAEVIRKSGQGDTREDKAEKKAEKVRKKWTRTEK